MKRLLFYVDPVSPYTYFAFHLLPNVAKKHNLLVDVRSVLFAGLLNASGGKGPAEVSPKRNYIFLDCIRLSKLYNIPFTLPPAHPFNPLLPLRTSFSIDDPSQRLHYMQGITDACWKLGQDINDASVISNVAANCGLNASKMLAAAKSDDAKAALRTSTEEAIQRGVFGVPTFCIDNELFWGSDRLSHLDAYLTGELQVLPGEVEKMLDRPRGSDRKAFREGNRSIT